MPTAATVAAPTRSCRTTSSPTIAIAPRPSSQLTKLAAVIGATNNRSIGVIKFATSPKNGYPGACTTPQRCHAITKLPESSITTSAGSVNVSAGAPGDICSVVNQIVATTTSPGSNPSHRILLIPTCCMSFIMQPRRKHKKTRGPYPRPRIISTLSSSMPSNERLPRRNRHNHP